MKSTRMYAATLASLLVLTSCGGGDGADAGPAPVAKLEGVNQLRSASGVDSIAMYLEDGTVWGMSGAISATGFTARMVRKGTFESGDGKFTLINAKNFYFDGTKVVTFDMTSSGTYVPGVSIQGSSTPAGGQPDPFSGAPLGGYDYNVAANISAIAGAWSMSEYRGIPFNVNIASSGAIAGTSGACTFTGTVVPRPSGKNVFDVTALTGASCAPANATLSGVALTYALSNGSRELIVIAMDANRTAATGMTGSR